MKTILYSIFLSATIVLAVDKAPHFMGETGSPFTLRGGALGTFYRLSVTP